MVFLLLTPLRCAAFSRRCASRHHRNSLRNLRLHAAEQRGSLSEQKAKRANRAEACVKPKRGRFSVGRTTELVEDQWLLHNKESQASSRPRQYCPRDSTASSRRARSPLSLRRSSHRRKTHPRARSPIPPDARLGAPRTSRSLSREKHRKALFPPSRRRRPSPRRQKSSSRHSHRLRQDALLQPARSSTPSSKIPTPARSTSSPPKR